MSFFLLNGKASNACFFLLVENSRKNEEEKPKQFALIH